MLYFTKHIVRFILAIGFQIFFINQVDLGSASTIIYPLFYIIFILLLPISTTPIYLLLLALVGGIIIDLFMNTGGMHASSLLLVAFARPYVLKIISPREDYDPTKDINVSNFGFRKFSLYVMSLSLIHHIWFFSVEYFKFSELHIILVKSLTSAIVTWVLIFLISSLTSKKPS